MPEIITEDNLSVWVSMNDLEMPKILLPSNEHLNGEMSGRFDYIGATPVVWYKRNPDFAGGAASIHSIDAIGITLRDLHALSDEIPVYQYVLELPNTLMIDPDKPFRALDLQRSIQSIEERGLLKNMGRFVTIYDMSNRSLGMLLKIMHENLKNVPNVIVSSAAECLEFTEDYPLVQPAIIPYGEN